MHDIVSVLIHSVFWRTETMKLQFIIGLVIGLACTQNISASGKPKVNLTHYTSWIYCNKLRIHAACAFTTVKSKENKMQLSIRCGMYCKSCFYNFSMFNNTLLHTTIWLLIQFHLHIHTYSGSRPTRCLDWHQEPEYCLEWEKFSRCEIPSPFKRKWDGTTFSRAHSWQETDCTERYG